MGRKYKIHDQQQVYFVTFTVVGWIDLFIRDEYKQIVIDSIKYCQQHKGLEVYAWCIMTSHVHLIIGASAENKLEDIIRDMKRHTSKTIRHAIETNPIESRKAWMIYFFEGMGMQNSNNNDWQLWHNTITPLNYQHLHLQNNALTICMKILWKQVLLHKQIIGGGKGIIEIIFVD